MMKLALAALLLGLVACGSDDPQIVIPDTPPQPMRCDPLKQTGCAAGEKCANKVLQVNPTLLIEVACVPDGTVDIDGACRYLIPPTTPDGSGGSTCKAGGECIGGVCKQVCDHQGADPKCDANHACGTYESFFESGGMTIAGVCDTRCDPLKQELAVGARVAACGSMDPAVADNGCFSFNMADWTCAGIPDEALNLTDRMRAYGPPTGGAYVNGCAAGYIPRFFEQDGSMIRICMGVCAPARTDNTAANMGNAKGDAAALVKLHNKAAPAAGDGLCLPGVKGSEADMNCQYLWFWNVDMTGYLPGPHNNTSGLCFGYTHYTVDHDENPATPRIGFPKCESLPPMGGTADPQYGFAEEWGCAPKTAFALTGEKIKPAIKNFMKDVHAGLGEGPARRHVLRQ